MTGSLRALSRSLPAAARTMVRNRSAPVTEDTAANSMKHVVQQAGWAGAFEIAGLALRYGLILLIARLLGPHGLGLYALALAFANGATALAAFGLDQATLRFIPYHRVREQSGEIVGLSLFATILVGTLASTVGLALFLGAPGIEALWGQPGLSNAVRIIAIAIPFTALGQVWHGALKGFQHIRLAVFLKQIMLPLTTIVGLLTIHLIRPGEPISAVGSAALAYWVVGLISLIYVARRVRQIDSTPVYQPATWMKFALPMSLEGGLLFLVLWTDHLMIGWLLNANDVGIYMSVVRVAAFVALPLLAVNAVFGPMVASLHAQGDRATLQRLYSRLSWCTALLGSYIAIFLWATGQWVLGIFGPAFLAGHLALMILIAGQAVNSCTGSSGLVLGMTGRAGWRLMNAAITAGLNVALNLLLIPQWGIAGAAVATAVSLGTINVLQVIEVRWLVGLSAFDWKSLGFKADPVADIGSEPEVIA